MSEEVVVEPGSIEAPPTSKRSRTVAKNSLWLMLDAMISMTVSFGLSIAVARALEPGVLGVYNFMLWLTNSATMTLSAGAFVGIQRFAAERYSRGDVRGMLEVLRRGLRWQMFCAALLVIPALSAIFLLAPAHLHIPGMLIVFSLLPMLFLAVPSAGLAATQRFDLSVLPSMSAMMVNVVLSIVTLYCGWGLIGLTSALFASRVVDCALRYRIWHRLLPSLKAAAAPTDGDDSGALDAETSQRYVRFIWRSSLLLLIDLIVWERSEFLVLSEFRPMADLAFFSLPFNIVQQAVMLPKMLTWSLAADIMTQQGRDPTRVAPLVADAIRYVSILAAPLVLGLCALAPALMPLLYGSRYLEAIPVLTVVAAFATIRGLQFPVQEMLRMSERQSFLIRWGLLMAGVTLGLDFLLIPKGGAVGAAFANGTGQCLATIGLTTYAIRKLGLRLPIGDMLRILAACLPMVLAVRMLSSELDPAAATALSIPLGALLYLGGLRLVGVLRNTDVDRLGSLERLLPALIRPRWKGLLGALAPTRARAA